MPLAGYNIIAYGSVLRLGYQGVVGFPGLDQGIFRMATPTSKCSRISSRAGSVGCCSTHRSSSSRWADYS